MRLAAPSFSRLEGYHRSKYNLYRRSTLSVRGPAHAKVPRSEFQCSVGIRGGSRDSTVHQFTSQHARVILFTPTFTPVQTSKYTLYQHDARECTPHVGRFWRRKRHPQGQRTGQGGALRCARASYSSSSSSSSRWRFLPPRRLRPVGHARFRRCSGLVGFASGDARRGMCTSPSCRRN